MHSDRTPEIEAFMIHEPFLRGIARAILKEESRVDDVMQDTWRAALTHRPRDPGAVRSWLGKIAGNFARRSVRGDASRDRREGAQPGPAAPPTPSEIVEREETRRRVFDALMAMAEPDRDVLLLRFYEDLPPREVARRLSIPTETARTRIRRALGRLREELDQGYGGDRRARLLALLPLAKWPLPAAAGITLTVKIVTGAAAILLVAAGVSFLAGSVDEAGPNPPARPPAAEPAPSSPLPGRAEDLDTGREAPEPPSREPRPARDWPDPLPGMVEIPAGPFTMGVDEGWFEKVYLEDRASRPPQFDGSQEDPWWQIFLLETPAHRVETDAYAIDRYEVTNAQYLRFLDDACRIVVVTDPAKRSIEQVAAEIYGESASAWQVESLYWLNEAMLGSMAAEVIRANPVKVLRAIEMSNRDLPAAAHRTEFEDLPERDRVKAWVGFELPEGIAIKGYTRTVPNHWRKAQPVESDNPDLDQQSQPVRWVSGEDAEAFAAWAGKHVPTEAEWEKAARGPENTIYPWGDGWDCIREKDRVIWNGARPWEGAPGKDRPAPVDSCPDGRSGYGVFHMLGNVMEWTSSVPEIYPRSAANWYGFGGRDLRVCRGGAYGGGVAYKAKEISIRTTARILDGPDGGVDVANRYSALGFRCAKYGVPGRDVLAATAARHARDGRIPHDLDLDPTAAFGVERVSFDPDAERNRRMVFVTGRARVIGVVPVRHAPTPTVAGLVAASDSEPQILGLLEVDRDLGGGGAHLIALSQGKLVLLAHGLAGSEIVGTLEPVPDFPVLSRLGANEGGTASLDVGASRVDFLIPLPVDAPSRAAPLALRFRLTVSIPEDLREGWRGTGE